MPCTPIKYVAPTLIMSQAYGNSRLPIEKKMTLITDMIDPTQVNMKSG